MASVTSTDHTSSDSGLAAGIATYVMWGFLPLLFNLLNHVGAATVVANRTLWSLLVLGVIMILGGRLAEVRAALRDPRTVTSMALAALILGANWLIYIYAVETGQVLEASFGYFILPLVNVATGVLLLGERLNRWQLVAIAIAAVAIAIQAVSIGGIPYVALGLALTFAVYGYLRKTAKVGSAPGLFVETIVLAPLAIAFLGYSFVRDGGLGWHADPYSLSLLALTGPATVVPLLLFAFAVQRLKMTTVGMLQYIAPSITFILAITLFGEHLNAVRLGSFALIWVSLIVYTTDSVLRRRRATA
ncbi:MAG TPA: EamA family transporter RarD [Devosia sp.]|uniref:EamA family transporter RarD n=1 Tax=Devosia sp. TaxID=1871048 RepID=UPI002DDCAB31|nr:EamA family transporter RarD [Devosia sp.]HEV2518640.1 EamA family transporter RarD [Devosia sp.]